MLTFSMNELLMMAKIVNKIQLCEDSLWPYTFFHKTFEEKKFF